MNMPMDMGENDPDFRARLLLERQREACLKDRIPSADTRREQLRRLAALAVENRDRLTAAVNADFGGRPAMETELLELVPLTASIRHARRHLKGWMKPKRRTTDLTFWPGRAELRCEPLGVVGIMSPFNYPVLLALGPLVDALAAGNRAILKPSELTPETSDLLTELIGTYFDEEEVAVVTGGVEVAAAFSALPFDHLFFTGSPNVGRKVAHAAADNLVPTTLELGGKSPAIWCEDYPLEKVARSVALGKFLNAGQTCIAPDYLLVPHGEARAVAGAIMMMVKQAYPDLDGGDFTSVIAERHRVRLEGLIADAEMRGARIYRAGDAPEGKLAPTLVTHLPEDAALMKEEIFGPILPILEYDEIEDALEIVNGHERPLALYAFTNDKDVRERILNGAISGGVTLNGTLAHIGQNNLPFGGVGQSGWGAYHGETGFRRLSHERGIFEVRGLDTLGMFRPPWAGWARWMARLLIRK